MATTPFPNANKTKVPRSSASNSARKEYFDIWSVKDNKPPWLDAPGGVHYSKTDGKSFREDRPHPPSDFFLADFALAIGEYCSAHKEKRPAAQGPQAWRGDTGI